MSGWLSNRSVIGSSAIAAADLAFAKAIAELHELRVENLRLRALLHEVAGCAVDLTAIDALAQIDRETWDAICAIETPRPVTA